MPRPGQKQIYHLAYLNGICLTHINNKDVGLLLNNQFKMSYLINQLNDQKFLAFNLSLRVNLLMA